MSHTTKQDSTDVSARPARPIGGWPTALAVRICVVMLALLAACAAAAAFLSVAAIVLLQGEEQDLPLAIMIPLQFQMRLLLFGVDLMPAAVVVAALSEYFGIRSLWFSTVAGVAVSAGYLLWSGRDYAYFDQFPSIQEAAFYLSLSIAAGATAGLAYWWIAGRNAGNWRGVSTARAAAVLSGTAIVAVLAVAIAPSAAGFYRLLRPVDTDAAWESKVGWRLCNDAIAAWPRKAAPACWKLTICDNEGGLSPAERRHLKDMMAEMKCDVRRTGRIRY
jgi:hypothetical protein